MFNIFKKKVQESTINKESISTLLVLSMAAYLEEISKMQPSLSIDSLQKKYNELERLGLQNTQNAKEIKNLISKEEDAAKAGELIKFVKELQKHFGEKTILVSSEQFDKILKEYDLSFGLLSEYNGTIPEENIKEIAKARDKVVSFPYIRQIYKDGKYDLFCVDGYYNASTADREYIDNYFKEYGRFILLPFSYDIGGRRLKNSPTFEDHYDKVKETEARGHFLTAEEFFIACPKKYLNNPEIKISSAPVDPIIFQKCSYGVIVYSVWGEEAEDVTLQKYLEINKKIASL